MFTLIRGGQVYAPSYLGRQDILLGGGRILHMAPTILPQPTYGPVHTVEASDFLIVPGFIDQHVHILGGGGESGFASRTPEILLSQITTAGVTTVVGCLGTDGTTRSSAALLAKARGLTAEGITAYLYTGAYELPPPTLTGSVRSDIILIPEILGCGEIALSDHRSSHPTFDQLAKLASQSRLGGMLSGKAGVVHLHLGDGAAHLDLVFSLIEQTELPITQFTPTHLNRSDSLLAEGIRFALAGGMLDVTSSMEDCGIAASQAVATALSEGVPPERITMSSDGNGSMPIFDDQGRLLGLTVASIHSLHRQFCRMVQDFKIPLACALSFITANPARSLGLDSCKGQLAPGKDADLLLLSEQLSLHQLYARGQLLVDGGRPIKKGAFETI